MIAEARRRIAAQALSLQFNETKAGRLAIIATELASNLVKHAGGGELYVSAAETDKGPAVDLLAIDRGPGMSDVEACLRDGYSTAGSPGTGLGAIRRLALTFDVHSVVDVGTVVHARVLGSDDPRPFERVAPSVYGLSLPYPGEVVVGDAWTHRSEEHFCTIAVIDGLGHGQLAAEASGEAVAAFHRSPPGALPLEILEDIHAALRCTRGAVACVARVDFERCEVLYTGIGNIAAMIVSSKETKRLVSHNGTLGGQVRRFNQLRYPFPAGSVLVATSDGLSTHIDLAKYPGLVGRSAPVIAGVLMRDLRRGRDDATVVVVRETGTTQ